MSGTLSIRVDLERDVNTGPMKGETWMSAARMRDQRAKEVEWETLELNDEDSRSRVFTIEKTNTP